MEAIIKTGRAFYGICMVTMGVNQFIYADFRTVVLPPWPSWRASPEIAAYIIGAALIAGGLTIIFSKKGKETALVFGSFLLALVIFWHLPYLLFIQPNKIRHLGLWVHASKALALAGGAFVVAGSFPGDSTSGILSFPAKLIPYGRIFFSITMIEFGIDHFLYADSISTMVPGWIPAHMFWTYVAGIALIGGGVAIIFKIQLKLVGLLMGSMIFIWFIVLHIPNAIARPTELNGNEVVSAGDALAFSGTAFIIAFLNRARRR